jgi:hypothetical protein
MLAISCVNLLGIATGAFSSPGWQFDLQFWAFLAGGE